MGHRRVDLCASTHIHSFRTWLFDTPFRHPSTLPRRPKIYITPVQSVQYIHTTVTQRTASWSSHSLSLATYPSPTIEHHIYSTYIFHSYSLKHKVHINIEDPGFCTSLLASRVSCPNGIILNSHLDLTTTFANSLRQSFRRLKTAGVEYSNESQTPLATSARGHLIRSIPTLYNPPTPGTSLGGRTNLLIIHFRFIQQKCLFRELLLPGAMPRWMMLRSRGTSLPSTPLDLRSDK